MALTHQKFFIVFILLISFAGRIAIYTIPIQKPSVEVLKENISSKADQSNAADEENQLAEKLKLTDLMIPKFVNFEFLNSSELKNALFQGNFNLTYCHLQVQEQPPK